MRHLAHVLPCCFASFAAKRKLNSQQKFTKEKLTHFFKFKDFSDLSSPVRPAVRKSDAFKSNSYYFDTSEGQNKNK